jgi:hypothetical protein
MRSIVRDEPGGKSGDGVRVRLADANMTVPRAALRTRAGRIASAHTESECVRTHPTRMQSHPLAHAIRLPLIIQSVHGSQFAEIGLETI